MCIDKNAPAPPMAGIGLASENEEGLQSPAVGTNAAMVRGISAHPDSGSSNTLHQAADGRKVFP
jgi:hypothetical protein